MKKDLPNIHKVNPSSKAGSSQRDHRRFTVPTSSAKKPPVLPKKSAEPKEAEPETKVQVMSEQTVNKQPEVVAEQTDTFEVVSEEIVLGSSAQHSGTDSAEVEEDEPEGDEEVSAGPHGGPEDDFEEDLEEELPEDDDEPESDLDDEQLEAAAASEAEFVRVKALFVDTPVNEINWAPHTNEDLRHFCHVLTGLEDVALPGDDVDPTLENSHSIIRMRLMKAVKAIREAFVSGADIAETLIKLSPKQESAVTDTTIQNDQVAEVVFDRKAAIETLASTEDSTEFKLELGSKSDAELAVLLQEMFDNAEEEEEESDEDESEDESEEESDDDEDGEHEDDDSHSNVFDEDDDESYEEDSDEDFPVAQQARHLRQQTFLDHQHETKVASVDIRANLVLLCSIEMAPEIAAVGKQLSAVELEDRELPLDFYRNIRGISLTPPRTAEVQGALSAGIAQAILEVDAFNQRDIMVGYETLEGANKILHYFADTLTGRIHAGLDNSVGGVYELPGGINSEDFFYTNNSLRLSDESETVINQYVFLRTPTMYVPKIRDKFIADVTQFVADNCPDLKVVIGFSANATDLIYRNSIGSGANVRQLSGLFDGLPQGYDLSQLHELVEMSESGEIVEDEEIIDVEFEEEQDDDADLDGLSDDDEDDMEEDDMEEDDDEEEEESDEDDESEEESDDDDMDDEDDSAPLAAFDTEILPQDEDELADLFPWNDTIVTFIDVDVESLDSEAE